MALADSGSDIEVIFESWLFKLRANTNRQLLRLSPSWQKKYFLLIRESNKPRLLYFNKKPTASHFEPKGNIDLSRYYRVEKKSCIKGKDLVCQLTTSDRVLWLAADKEHIHHLLAFFLTTQTRLKDTVEGECFVVRPDNSEDHRKIGSRGAMCLLHVSQTGVTLALQMSRCVLAQWPLRCVRSYECTSRGRFALDVGSLAATDRGSFVFNTRATQDSALYDRIDSLVNELTALQGLVLSRESNSRLVNNVESLRNDYEQLAQLTVVESDGACITQLKRISRDIYDHLAEHLGGTSGHLQTSLGLSMADVTAVTPTTAARSIMRPMHQRDVRTTAAAGSSAGGGCSSHPAILSSQYLHMSATEDSSTTDDAVGSWTQITSQAHSLPAAVPHSLQLSASVPSSHVDYCLERPTGSLIETNIELYVNNNNNNNNNNAGDAALSEHEAALRHQLIYQAASTHDSLVPAAIPLEYYVGMTSPSDGSVASDSVAINPSYVNDVVVVSPTDASVYSYACTPDFHLLTNSQQQRHVTTTGSSVTAGRPDTLINTLAAGNTTTAVSSTSTIVPATAASVASVASSGSVASSENVCSPTHSVHSVPGINVSTKTRIFSRQKSAFSTTPV